MGTEVQSKMNLPGYYLMREPENNVGSKGWPLNNDCRASKSKSTTAATNDEFLQHAKEKLRQTMLMHESIFQHQLKELHRVYGVQREMMNELKGKTTNYSSRTPYDDEKRQFNHPNGSLEKSGYGRSSTSIIDNIQTLSSVSGISMQSKVGSSQNGINFNHCQPLESKCKKLQTRLFDLELPADEYIDSQEKQPEVSGASMLESYPSVTNFRLSQKRYDGLNAGIPENSGCNRDASSSHISTKRPFGFTDLNELVEEAPGSASGNNLGILKSGEIGKQNLSAHLSSGFLANDNCQKFCKEKKGAGLSFTHLERVQRGWSPHNYEVGNSRSDRISFSKSSYPEDSCISFKSQRERRIASETGVPLQIDEKSTGKHRPRTIFGVGISERNHFESAAAFQKFGLHPLFHRTDEPNPEPFTILSSEVPSSFKDNALSSLEGSCSRTSPQLNKNDPGSVKSVHASFNEKLRYALPSKDKVQNSDCFGKGLQLDFQELRASNPSIICVQPNGTRNCNVAYEPLQLNAMRHPGGLDFITEKKSSNYVNRNMPHFQRPQNESVSQIDLISNDGQRKQEYQQVGMPWFKVRPQTSSEIETRIESPFSNNSDKLKNGSRTVKRGGSSYLTEESSVALATKNFQHNIHIGDISTPTTFPGFPLLCKPHLTKDLTSPSSSSQSRSFGSMINGGRITCHLNVSARSEARIESNLSVRNISVKGHTNLKHHFDLNISASEEEAGAADPSPKSSTRISAEEVEIVSDAALLLDNEKNVTNPENIGESLKDSARIAAEAIVSISSSSPDRAHASIVDCQHPEPSLDDPLHWFTDIIFSYKDDSHNMVGAVSKDNNDACHEDSVPEGLDYFEYMTLKLTEIQAEECIFKPEAPETPEKERPMARRPRRGQARRRQRKDFQRDVLPALTSLSKYEVKEDLQAFRSLIRAAGGSWESGMTQRNASKGSSRRGRKRSRNSAPTPSKTASCQPHIQQSTSRDTSFCEGSLTGWGKRTKRLPRQRCQLGKPCVT